MMTTEPPVEVDEEPVAFPARIEADPPADPAPTVNTTSPDLSLEEGPDPRVRLPLAVEEGPVDRKVSPEEPREEGADPRASTPEEASAEDVVPVVMVTPPPLPLSALPAPMVTSPPPLLLLPAESPTRKAMLPETPLVEAPVDRVREPASPPLLPVEMSTDPLPSKPPAPDPRETGPLLELVVKETGAEESEMAPEGALTPPSPLIRVTFPPPMLLELLVLEPPVISTFPAVVEEVGEEEEGARSPAERERSPPLLPPLPPAMTTLPPCPPLLLPPTTPKSPAEPAPRVEPVASSKDPVLLVVEVGSKESPVVTVRAPELTLSLKPAPVDKVTVPVEMLVAREGRKDGSLELLPITTDPDASGEEEAREVDTPVVREMEPGVLPAALLLPEVRSTLPPTPPAAVEVPAVRVISPPLSSAPLPPLIPAANLIPPAIPVAASPVEKVIAPLDPVPLPVFTTTPPLELLVLLPVASGAVDRVSTPPRAC